MVSNMAEDYKITDARAKAGATKTKTEVSRCKCTNNYSWIFWIILLAMVGYFIYYIITTIQAIQANPEDWFEGMGGIITIVRNGV